jgi:hypothetical protein
MMFVWLTPQARRQHRPRYVLAPMQNIPSRQAWTCGLAAKTGKRTLQRYFEVDRAACLCLNAVRRPPPNRHLLEMQQTG